MYQLTTLRNGLRIATASMPHMASVCVGFWANVGSRHESASLNGISHFIEHGVFKGTQRRDARSLTEDVEGIGGYLNAFTSEENTCYYARALAKHLPTLVDVLADMYLNPSFPDEEIEKERDVILEEVAMYMDQPAQAVLEDLNEALWPGHPLGRSITGSPESLVGIGAGQLRRFWKRHYVAPNTLITAAGPIEHQAFVRLVRRNMRHLRDGQATRFKPVPKRTPPMRLKVKRRRCEQAHVAIGIKTVPRRDTSRHAYGVLNAILGENMSSRLFQSLREEHGLAYAIHSTTGYFHDTGNVTISAGVELENVARSLDLIRDHLRALREVPVTRKELELAKEYLLGQWVMHLEGTENHMTWLGEHVLGFDSLPRPELSKERLMRVTREEVQQAAQAAFRPEHTHMAVISGGAPQKVCAAFIDDPVGR